MNRLITGITAFFFSICVFFSVSAGPVEETPEKQANVEDLKSRLNQVREDLTEVQEEIAQETRKFNQFQHDVVYTNEAAVRIYNEIKGLEKILVQKRKDLNEMIQKFPEMRELMKKRGALFGKRRKLRDQEQMIVHEIKAEQRRAGKK